MEKSSSLKIYPDETLDYLRKWDLKVIQGKRGYRFSIDSLLLAEFARLPERGVVCDLGAGCGVITMIVARKKPRLSVVGIDVQEVMIERAKRSAEINALSNRVCFVKANYKDVKDLFGAESFDYVITNPPYWKPGKGRMVKEREKAVARYELEADLNDLIKAIFYLLKYRRRCSIIYAAERTTDLISSLRHFSLEPKRIRFVHPYVDKKAQFVLVEAIKGGKEGTLDVEPPLVIYKEKNVYTKEVASMIGVKV